MNKLTSIALIIACSIATGLAPAAADERYDLFMKKEVSQFNGDPVPKNCQRKVKKVDGATYRLCAVKGKPVEISITVGPSIVTYFYKNSKLVRYNLIEGETEVGRGFKNDKLMAVWDKAQQTVQTGPFPEPENASGTITNAYETLAVFGFKTR